MPEQVVGGRQNEDMSQVFRVFPDYTADPV